MKNLNNPENIYPYWKNEFSVCTDQHNELKKTHSKLWHSLNDQRKTESLEASRSTDFHLKGVELLNIKAVVEGSKPTALLTTKAEFYCQVSSYKKKIMNVKYIISLNKICWEQGNSRVKPSKFRLKVNFQKNDVSGY